MPITKSAKKSLKVSKTRRKQNQKQEIALDKAVKNVNDKNVNQAISVIDKAAKTGIIAKNKAARLKSQIMKKFKARNTKSETNKIKPIPKTAKTNTKTKTGKKK